MGFEMAPPRNGEYWFRPRIIDEETWRNGEGVWEAARTWAEENVPFCYLTINRSSSACLSSILIIHPTYATAFRMRWC